MAGGILLRYRGATLYGFDFAYAFVAASNDVAAPKPLGGQQSTPGAF